MHARRGFRRCNAGYTLAELAVMLAVAGVLLAMGLPSFARYQRSTSLRNTFRQLVFDLRLARQQALAQHHNVVAVFDAGPPAYYGAFADQDGDLHHDAGEPWLVQRTLAAAIGLDASNLTPADSLAFDPAGRSPGAWTGGLVQMSGTAGSGTVRTLRAWPSGSIETLAPGP